MRADLARSLCEALFASPENAHEIIQETLERFCASCKQRGEEEACAGALILTREQEEDTNFGTTVRLWCAFTTASMAIAYASSYDPKPRVLVLRQPSHVSPTRNDESSSRVYITMLPLTRD